jgi:hypothetical protein
MWEGGRGNEALGEVLLCHVVLCRWLISFCFDRSLYSSRRVMVERSFFFPRGRERTRFVGTLRLFHSVVSILVQATRAVVGGVSWCRCCLVVWQLNLRGRDLFFLFGGWWRKKVSLVKDIC